MSKRLLFLVSSAFTAAAHLWAVPAPAEFRGIYLSFWQAGINSKIDEVLRLQRDFGINAVVIDVKDSTGTVGYVSRVADVQKYHVQRAAIRDLDGVIKRLHDAGIYTIARVAVFEDGGLQKARPELAVRRGSLTGAPWRDRKGLGWVDAGSKAVWDYDEQIADEAFARGFDEVNFDYVRFPSDGNLKEMKFPFSGLNPERHKVLRGFFANLRARFPNKTISADLFGLTTVVTNDLGIGQLIEDAAEYFDYICPMVYPSHFASGFGGFKRPAAHPYEVIHASMQGAAARLKPPAGGKPFRAKVRPWLQVFDLGAKYTPDMVAAQIRGAKDGLGSQYAGYLLWNPSSRYAVLPTSLKPVPVPTRTQAAAPARNAK